MTGLLLAMLQVVAPAPIDVATLPKFQRDAIALCNLMKDHDELWQDEPIVTIEFKGKTKTLFTCTVRRNVLHDPSNRPVQGQAQPGKRLRSSAAAGNSPEQD